MKNQFFILLQFFLIIFVYHLLKDLKDSLIITASDAGAEVIPFIKIWGDAPSVGYALTSNLIEVAWKNCVKAVYTTPQAYNAYINQLTSLIGLFSVIMALTARWLFQKFSWSTIALMSPLALFITSFLFFFPFHLPAGPLEQFATHLGLSTAILIMTAGSCYYVVSLTAKYTLFDTCKEMAYLSIDLEKRMKAKAIIDSLGSRLGKSGASCIYQALFLFFGTITGNISLIGAIAVSMIGMSIFATWELGSIKYRMKEGDLLDA